MNDILEFIEDLEMLEVLPDGGTREAHIEYLLKKYRNRADAIEKDMERQEDLFDNLPV